MLRTWGRVYNLDGTYSWVQVTTDAGGLNDDVYLTTLVQVCKLGRGESPFFANYGIPAQQAVIQQIFPDYYVNQTQTQFSFAFANLQISRTPALEPTYQVNIVLNSGAQVSTTIYGTNGQFAITENGQPGVTDTGQQVIVG